MTVVVGYRAGKIGLSGLQLAVRAARTLRTSLTVATIVGKPWLTPPLAEYQHWADQLAADSATEARRYLRELADGVDVTYQHRAHRSVSGGLIEVVEETDAEVLVLGSLPGALPGLGALPGRGGVVIGSTAGRLLHSSPVPVAISPSGYRAHTGSFTRLTCAYAATAESIGVLRRCIDFAEEVQLPVRVITFAVRGRTMYPPEVGLDAEDSILDAWATQAREILENLKTEGIVGENVVLQVVTGNSWEEALHAAEWDDGEILALGTSPGGEIRRVFLGSRATKIIRHSPIPVLVLPG
ncbi:universal stress protein [Mycobacterium lacus]|uniref:Universal stress protein n=1 Tax=Mycobacterium lacus TaxID=169765 RepID=A0A1X1Y123_9MYCO|nr:universal stress protein [Mycobacterium lacus]MCV7123309.1 universal stress protein [Mycobacterium lacus]ORW04721.1 universal stress protein [Mycobacterium lacus]BBX97087.1 universal stress protein [Mycobacterium lacus]